MKPEKYNEISGKYRYEELKIPSLNDQMALFYDGRISRKDFPSDLYIYDIRHSDESGDPCTIEQHAVVDFYGTIITYKPIDLGSNSYIEINGYDDFIYTDRYFEASEVQKWANGIKTIDNNSQEVLEFINDFVNRAKACNIDEQAFMSVFRAGYCYHFASMLKDVFNRGEIYITAPIGHVVWRDIDNRYYDIEGEYLWGDHDVEAMVSITYNDFSNDFKHVSNSCNGIGTSKKEIDMAINEFSNKFPNK